MHDYSILDTWKRVGEGGAGRRGGRGGGGCEHNDIYFPRSSRRPLCFESMDSDKIVWKTFHNLGKAKPGFASESPFSPLDLDKSRKVRRIDVSQMESHGLAAAKFDVHVVTLYPDPRNT